ncbi:hypothetical protein M433DRAFT_2347 [Acidomyces richmondensis BFW]|nr:MAG: hypothetical protein FE78DRAFT_27742 [Acidomyces sp. 'richmondensis']KYG48038.1 hypothetical protein M433DRAFT_2347 [Acidomyces richmondensis BFW]
MAHHQPASPLLRLPPELRNQIYDEVLVQQANESFTIGPKRLAHPFLAVCRQIRSEGSGIFYANNKFRFNDPEVCIEFLRHCTSLRQRELIRELRYDTSQIYLDPASWRLAFQDLPGLHEDCKLGSLKCRLAESGIFLEDGVLRAGIRVNGQMVWTANPLSTAKEAVAEGNLLGRVIYV